MKKREVAGLNIALLDILTGALGAVIILYVAVPKGSPSVQEVSAPSPQSLEALEKNYENLKAAAKKIAKQVEETEKKNQLLSETVSVKNEEIESLRKELEKRKAAGSLEVQPPEENQYRGKGLPVDVGFKFKGKKIVFIIDVSGSMVREDRIGQVKAGLKMLITSMPKDYALDVVQFPGRNRELFRPLWGYLKNLESYQKDEVYRFLLSLQARGYTPTRSALMYALSKYKDLTDIVLLTDGAPTNGNSSKEASISKLLMDINRKNSQKVRINTIGVGSSFVKNRGSKAYVFLQELAKDHGGFFYGF
ncbi:MAG: vWA domain-containing protein [Bdellovibrionota bacterium]|nr:vWA domain-containing protein [Bdellovibrionota bacterium]